MLLAKKLNEHPGVASDMDLAAFLKVLSALSITGSLNAWFGGHFGGVLLPGSRFASAVPYVAAH
ncbi:hypothetical protein [Muricoccus radiodurans]|uniref:hypothetical protein n=1 Tax=Muricoccus radiodurans TaxID=2231721 RepID=UPI003CECF73C